MFSGMFKTFIGPEEKDALVAYLRPETAGAIFLEYKNVVNSTVKKIPFGIGQIGKAFRNEITAGQFIFRMLEFEQMEIEYFIDPESDWNETFERWVKDIYGFARIIGLPEEHFYNHEIEGDDRAFYSKRTIDIEYLYPWGHDEIWAIAYRTDYDLSRHQEHSGEKMEYLDEKSGRRFLPHVIEPTFGVDRTVLALLVEAYNEETLENGEQRVVLKFNPRVAPYKAAVFPLLKNKPQLVEKAREIFNALKNEFTVEFDDNGNIGKRYRRQDEIGTPFCVTVDFDSLEKDDVTVRDRDTMKQERVKIGELPEYLKEKLK